MRYGGQQKSEIESWPVEEVWRYCRHIFDWLEKEYKA